MTISTQTLRAISKKVGANFKGKYNIAEVATTKKVVAPAPVVPVVTPAVVAPVVTPEPTVLPPTVEDVVADAEPVVDPTAPAVQLINNHTEA